jgi:hypothetical protein
MSTTTSISSEPAPAKKPISEAKRKANQQNAQKSTGPRTREGKDRAKFNNMTHTHAAETTLLPGEDGDALTARIAAWCDDLGVRDDAERTLVEAAACASWRAERCRRAETAAVAQRVDDAADAYDAAMLARLSALVGTTGPLANDPRGTLQQLRSFSQGCRWLIERWENLGMEIMEAGGLAPCQAEDVLRLQGLCPLDHMHNRRAMYWLAQAMASALSDNCRGVEDRGYFVRLFDPGPNRIVPAEYHRRAARRYAELPDRATANAHLLEFIKETIAELEDRIVELERRERVGRERAAATASVDVSAEGSRRHRYELGHQRVMLNCLRALEKLRATAIEPEPVDEPEPEPKPEPSARTEPTAGPPAGPAEGPSDGAELAPRTEPTRLEPGTIVTTPLGVTFRIPPRPDAPA